MDAAVNDKTIGLNRYKLQAINACRIYLRVFFLSELAQTDGYHVNMCYIKGTTRKSTTLQFPTQPKPTDYQWHQWRSFIVRRFIRGDPNQLIRSFTTPTTTTYHQQIQHNDRALLLALYHQHMGDEYSPGNQNVHSPSEEVVSPINTFHPHQPHLIQQLCDNMPPTLRQLIHPNTTDTITPTVIYSVLSLLKNNQLAAATDGSLIPNTSFGGCGYVLADRHNIHNKIEGHSPCPISLGMSSLSTEHYGVLALTTLLHIICISGLTPTEFKQLQQRNLQLPIYIDNIVLVHRLNNLHTPRLRLSEFTVPDYSLWEYTKEILQPLPFTLKAIWIQSHQDQRKPTKTNLSFEARLNIDADHQASLPLLHHTYPTMKRGFIPTSKISFFAINQLEINNMEHYITHSINGPPLINYYHTKYQWTSSTTASISWEGIHRALKQLSPPARLKQQQFLHNWQNTGQQKLKFAIAKLKEGDPPLSPEEYRAISSCPMGCGEAEHHGHYLLCKSDQATKQRKKELLLLQEKMDKLGTCPGLIDIFTRVMQGHTPQPHESTIQDWFTLSVSQAITEQATIGWDHMRRGFLTSKWTIVQKIHRQSSGDLSTFDAIRWLSQVIISFWGYGKSMWEIRNTTLHGATHHEARKLKIDLLRAKVKDLYHHKDRKYVPAHKSREYFGVPYQIQIKKGIHALSEWIDLVERRLHAHREEASKRTIHNWIHEDRVDEK